MEFHLGRFVHTQTGKTLMSILLGFGLASLFRTVCKGKDCLIFHAPPLEEIKDKIYKVDGKCVKYKQVATKCSSSAKTITFE
jgi:predicted nucleic acid-binding Zn finger protein